MRVKVSAKLIADYRIIEGAVRVVAVLPDRTLSGSVWSQAPVPNTLCCQRLVFAIAHRV